MRVADVVSERELGEFKVPQATEARGGAHRRARNILNQFRRSDQCLDELRPMVRVRFEGAEVFISHPSHCMRQQRGDKFGKFEERGWIQTSVPVTVVASTRYTLEAVTMRVAGVAEGINMPAPSAVALGWSWLQSARALEVTGCLVGWRTWDWDEKYCAST